MKKHLTTPFTENTIKDLCAGDEVLISGIIYTGRDAAHKRLSLLIAENRPLPVNLDSQVLYYTGPTPPRPGKAIGSAGPTTSSRMDRYTPDLIRISHLRGIIGKGDRSPDVIKSFIDYGCVYFTAIGGAGALLSKSITAAEVICYGDLGAEAIYKLTVKDFPAIVTIDCKGNNLYDR